jgi:hypothetical protein
VLDEGRDDAHHRVVAVVVAEAQRRGEANRGLARELLQDRRLQEVDRRDLEVDRAQHELGLAAGRADHQGELLGRPGAALPQRPLLGRDRDPQRHCQRHQEHDRDRADAVLPQVRGDQAGAKGS